MKRPAMLAAVGTMTLLSATQPSLSDGLTVKPVTDPIVREECSACHMLYPAGLLPSRSWTTMMGALTFHFGENAELDDAARKAVTDYLTANAADSGGRANKMLRALASNMTPARITELPYWKRKHDRAGRVSHETLKRRGAKSQADCKACHTSAEKGFFEDD